MARYEVTAPNGNKYQVTAPEGATLAELREYVKRKHPNSQSGAVGKNYGDDYQYQSEDPGTLKTIKDTAVGGLSGIYKAASGLVSIGSLIPGVRKVADPTAAWLHEAGEVIDEADRKTQVELK